MIKQPKRIKHLKKSEESSPFVFILITVGAFALMIGYVWLNNEVTVTLNDISALNKERLKNRTSVDLLDAEIARLERSDRITEKARNDLNMVFPEPEPVRLAVKVDASSVKSSGVGR